MSILDRAYVDLEETEIYEKLICEECDKVILNNPVYMYCTLCKDCRKEREVDLYKLLFILTVIILFIMSYYIYNKI